MLLKLKNSVMLGVIALLFCLVLFPWGLGVSPDSVSYLVGAQNIIQGYGYTFSGNWITLWPPGFSFFVALVKVLFCIDLNHAVLVFQVFLFVLLGFYMERTLNLIHPTNWHLRWTVVFAFMFSVPLASTTTMVSTELVFISIQMAAFYLLLRWVETKKEKILIQIGILIAIAIMVRFAAVALFGSVFLVIFGSSTASTRRKNLFVYVLCGILAPLIYHILVHFWLSAPTPREFIFHPISASQLKWSFWYFRGWFNGLPGFNFLFGFFVLVFSLLFIKSRKNHSSFGPNIVLIATGLNLVVYYLFLVFSASFFDKHIPLDNRLLAPMAPFVFILIYQVLVYFYLHAKWFIWASFLIFIPASVLYSSMRLWKSHYEIGQQYSGKEFAEYDKPIRTYLRNHRGLTFTNAPDLIFYKLNVADNLLELPKKSNPNTGLANPNLERDLQRLERSVMDSSAQIILFQRVDWRFYHPTVLELRKLLPKAEFKVEGSAIIVRSSHQNLSD
jgi:hypothetical protein